MCKVTLKISEDAMAESLFSMAAEKTNDSPALYGGYKYMCLSHRPGNFCTLLFVTPGEGLNPSAQT